MSGGVDESEFQARVIDALRDPRAFGAPGPVACIETHGAAIFLVGAHAFKMKRAIRYPYMDYGTLERREAMCRAEIDVNRRTAPSLYLGVAPVLRGVDGGFRVGAVNEAPARASASVVEWLVVMKRFGDGDLLLQMAEDGRLERDLLIGLAREIARFHDSAAVSRRHAGADAYRRSIELDAGQMEAHGDILDAALGHTVAHGLAAALDRLGPLVERRREGGAVRHCHGDLHLRNICLLDGRPTLFDAIEFNDRIATIDVLYDLAFLLMDLDHRGLRSYANLVLNNWLWRVGDVADASHLEALALLPMFLARRAAIRAFVGATALKVATRSTDRSGAIEEARGYQALAATYLSPIPPRLVAIGGLSGSGKSTLAMAIADRFGRAPGAVVLRSDVERKRAAGLPLEERLPAGSYSAESSARVYSDVLAKAETVLRSGQCVIVDAVFARQSEREEVARLADRMGVPFSGLWLDIDRSSAVGRVGSRAGDASDATPSVVERQFAYDLGTIDWHRIDAAGPSSESTRRAIAHLEA